MLPRTIALVAVLLMQACAAPSSTSNAYAEGVQAYRAKDYALARQKWEQVVAVGGNSSSENNLGYLLYYGLGGATDRARAIRLWYGAAKVGHAEAQWHLGIASEEGAGLPQSNAEAYAWYRCAVVNAERRSLTGDKVVEQTIGNDARASVASLRPKLNAEELVRAEAIANACIAGYPSRGGT